MKWFKHQSDMLDDVFVIQLVDEFGVAGYGIWCGILETYAKYCGENVGDFVTIPWCVLTDRLRTSAAKIHRVISFCETSAKLSTRTYGRCIDVSIPKMQALKDEWTSRKKKDSGVPREKLPYKSKEYSPNGESEFKNPEVNPPSPPAGGGVDLPKNNSSEPRGHRLPEGWRPSPETLDWVSQTYPHIGGSVEEILEEFAEYWATVPGYRGRKLSWDATFKNRIRDKQGGYLRKNTGARLVSPRETFVEASGSNFYS
jgi:hypothetical protein